MRKTVWSVSVLFLIILLQVTQVFAQSAGGIQEITGHLAAQEVDPFLIRGLREGQTLYAFMETTSGNLAGGDLCDAPPRPACPAGPHLPGMG
jgi:hypothetical protein